MVSGRKALHLIDAEIASQRRRVNASVQDTAGLSKQIITARRNEVSALEHISRLRLDFLSTGNAPESLGYIDRQAVKLLEQYELESANQAASIASIESQIQDQETERRKQEKSVETAIAAYDKAAAASQKKL